MQEKGAGAGVTGGRGTADDPRPTAAAAGPPSKSSSSSSSSARPRRAQGRPPSYEDLGYQSQEGAGSGRADSAGGGSSIGYSYQGYPGDSPASGSGSGRGGDRHPYSRKADGPYNTESHTFSASGSSSWERGVRSRDSASG